MKKKYLIALIIVLIIAMYSIISFPIQKYFAQKKFNEYINLQGTSIENIESKEFYRDTTMGGYNFKIKYKDDPEHLYEYEYYLRSKKSGKIISDTMECYVYNSSNDSAEYKNVKYPPLE